jgi:hypothetical protein
MIRKNTLLVALVLSSACILPAQVKPATQPPPPNEVAGIAVNYDETKTGTYTLPDPLMLASGKSVHDAKTWRTQRRPELVRLFETEQFGRSPGRPAAETFELTDKGTPALNGKALRKQITIRFSKDPAWPAIHLLEYLPANTKKPVPMLLSINFGAVQNAVDDPGITPITVWDPKTQRPISVSGRLPARALAA